ncbi:hypothetical protein N9N67_06385 [Bacteriovoracaceae bacterium]|nr:hypothetical protein [Bacteriovoracaceae bacterium]
MDQNEVTVFVVTIGEDSLDECVKAIENQTYKKDHQLPIEIIKDIFPMSEAFNEMHRRCQTKFFVQVDADVILKPEAVQTLYNAIKNKSFLTYASYASLYEEGFGVGGSVRCWRKSFFKWFPFRDARTVDRNLYKRARRFGFRRKGLKDVVGIHRPRYSIFSEYLKTKSDVEKWRFLGRKPKKYAIPLIEEMSKDPVKEKYRIFGALLGGMTGNDRVQTSKDFSLEKKRFDTLSNELQIEDFSQISIDKEYLNSDLMDLFAKSYGGDRQARLQLLSIFLDLFKLKYTEDNESLLKVIEE